MVSTWRYRVAGLDFESNLEIPEWSIYETADRAAEPDVRMVVAREAPPRLQVGEPMVASRDVVTFAAPDAGCYDVRHGALITVTPLPTAGDRELRLYLLGAAFAAVCYQRRAFLLHASVVRWEGRVIAMCGASHAGKSSLAAALLLQGADLISDDVSRVEAVGSGALVAYPSVPRVKLWEEALRHLPMDGQPHRDHLRASKFHIVRPVLAESPVRVDLVCLLEWHDGEATLVPLRGADAVHALARSGVYQPSLLDRMGRWPQYWTQCIEAARRVPVARLSRARAWTAMPEVVSVLRNHLERRTPDQLA